GQCHDRVGKWNINVVRIKIFGSPTPEDMNTLNKAINDINVNAKSFRMVIDDKNQYEPDMEIYFIPHLQFAQYSVNPSEADGFTEWLVSTSSIYGGNPAGEIFKVRVFIGSDQLSQARRSHVIVHELGHCLGFHHNQNRNSVLCYQGPVITEFTDLDKTMIRMLYREDILPNMSRNQVETILNNSRRSFFF
ncbi:MAG: M57 family metalloprotease, partial [Euryarchaeota archaeon]|nr:M57 family metalloprotease [Euryarchaeota archaeon]